MPKKKQKFRRTDAHKYSKLGVRRKKKQVYRKSKGIDNKIRLKMKGHLRNVSIGFRGEKKKRNLVKGLKAVVVFNLKNLKALSKGEIGVVGKIGSKKRIEIAEYAKEKNIKLLNLNPEKFLEEIKKKNEEIKKLREEREKKKKVKDKKSKEKKVKKEEKKEVEIKEEAVKHEADVKENVEEKK